jgi:hypothetical protein
MVFKKGQSGNKHTQFKPGQSGNPKGLPKGYKQLRTLIAKAAEKKVNYKDLNNVKQSMAVSEALVVSLMGNAIYNQDIRAAKFIIKTMDSYEMEVGYSPEINDEEYLSNEEDWLDLSKLTDEELDALEIVANAVQRISKEEEKVVK